MALKDRPLSWWKGKLFRYWCSADRNDTRRIHYKINHRSIGQGLRVFRFTSDDLVGWEEQYACETGRIHSLRLDGNEWYIEIDAGIIPEDVLK